MLYLINRFKLGFYPHRNIDQCTYKKHFKYGQIKLKRACLMHKNQWGPKLVLVQTSSPN